MLQRAASNAYSWWWASHIRTKQSKWMEQNLQDMEEKVQSVLKLIEEDGDSFAKRAEMYYKKRPELIHFVEESYRAYRALAERYDHISTELQNANNTIAYVFPEQVQFAMEDDEDEASPRFPKKPPEILKANIPKVPKIPKDLKGVFASATKKLQPKKSMKLTGNITVAKSGLSKTKGLQEIDKLQKQILALQTEKEFVKSSYEGGLAKYWEIEHQIREMQEKVCGLQDEFGSGTVIEDNEARTLMASAALKSCQETLAQLQEKQERSAEEAVVEHKRINNAWEQLKSLKDEFLHGQINQENPQAKDESVKAVEELKSSDQVGGGSTKESQDLELLREKIKKHFEVESNASLTITELAEKIDDVVNKVISLEAAVSSQTALIQRLRTETDELQAQIRTLEDDKATLINGKNDLSDKLREMEEKLHGLQDLDQSVEEQNNNLQTHFMEAHCNLDTLSDKVHSVKPDEEPQVTLQTEEKSLVKAESLKEFEGQEGLVNHNGSLEGPQNVKQEEDLEVSDKSLKELKEQEDGPNPNDGLEERQNVKPDKELLVSDSSQKEEETPAEVGLLTELKEHKENFHHADGSEKTTDNQTEEEEGKEHDLHASNINHRENVSQPQTNDDGDNLSKKFNDLKMEEKVNKQASAVTVDDLPIVKTQEETINQDDEPDWKQLFTNGMENREKALLMEYTTILRNYKEVKKKIAEAEKANGDSLFDITVQLRELKSANAKKDEQIRFLREKLSLLQAGLSEDNESEKLMVTDSPVTEKNVTEDIQMILMGHPEATSEIEERFRMNIDELLEQNLDFWLRFSTAFHQIQKFETEVKDLQSEFSKLEKKQKKQEGSSTAKYSLKSDAKPLYKHLREIYAELTVWLEKSLLLKDELKSRFSSLCDIQEEITAALKECAEDDHFKFTTHQAAKFQGEVLNMKQENNKVGNELQAGLDHVTALQLEVEKTLAKLNEEFQLSGSRKSQNIQLQHSESRSRVPLHSFIFGVKPKRQRQSFFSLVHPALHRKYNTYKQGSNV